MRTMKKFFSAVTIVALLVTGNPGWMKMTYADENGAVAEECGYDDDAIDALFHQREQLMLEMSKAAMEEKGAVAFSVNVDYDAEFDRIDDELQALGVRKIDPTNEEDMAYLKELPIYAGDGECVRADIQYDDAPDMSLIALSFDVYVSDKTITLDDGTGGGENTYRYRLVQVTDKEEGSTGQLYQRRKVKMLTAREIAKNQSAALLKHNFEILTDAFYGIFLKRPMLKWALENLQDFLNASKIYADVGTDEGYTTAHSSVTTMNYFYFDNPDYGWKLIASYASAFAERQDRFVGEINARPFDDDVHEEKYTMKSGSGRTYKEFAAAYVSVMDTRPDYFVSAWFGKLKLATYSGDKMEYEPKYADTPLDLLQLPNGSTY